jgi:hypothetical protein
MAVRPPVFEPPRVNPRDPGVRFDVSPPLQPNGGVLGLIAVLLLAIIAFVVAASEDYVPNQKAPADTSMSVDRYGTHPSFFPISRAVAAEQDPFVHPPLPVSTFQKIELPGASRCQAW